jgi:hypothetical protein
VEAGADEMRTAAGMSTKKVRWTTSSRQRILLVLFLPLLALSLFVITGQRSFFFDSLFSWNNKSCIATEWPRAASGYIKGMGIGSYAAGNVYTNMTVFDFDGHGDKRGMWFPYHISHSGAAAGDSTFFNVRPMGQMGMAHVNEPCDARSFRPAEPRSLDGFDSWEISGMGGWSGWVFIYVLDGDSERWYKKLSFSIHDSL